MSEKSAALLKELHEGIISLCNSGEWIRYLNFLARFPRYSFRNTTLIYMQRPDATMVGSMGFWNKLNGHVRKGSRAIKILAPHTIKVKNDRTGDDEEHIGFHVANVFDVSDVIVNLPDNMCHVLEDQVDDYGLLIDTLVDIAGCPVACETISGNAKGYFSPAENRIALKAGMPEAQTIKTLIHEIAHSILHCKGGSEEKADRDVMEQEAESCAYIVSRRLGIEDVGDYSFSYIAGWSGRNPDALMNSIEAITTTADEIWQRIEKRLAEKGGTS